MKIDSSELSLEQRVFRLRHLTHMRIVALGDSSVFGVGDFDSENTAIGAGWAGRIAHDLKAGRFLNLGKNGARARDLVKFQLNGALCMKPDLSLICVGTNDVLRGDFSPHEIRENINQVIGKLNSTNCLAVFLGIPNPMITAPGPMVLKKILSQRVQIVNSIIQAQSEHLGAVFIDTWDSQIAGDKSMWHIDRMHPSPKGHQTISDLVRRSLYLPRRSRKKLPIENGTIEKKDELFWLITNGAKWFAKRSIDLVPAIIWLIICGKFQSKKLSIDIAVEN